MSLINLLGVESLAPVKLGDLKILTSRKVICVPEDPQQVTSWVCLPRPMLNLSIPCVTRLVRREIPLIHN